MSDEVTAEELLHPESLRSVHAPRAASDGDGLWSPARRPLTLGLVLTITIVAAEALAVATAMPIVARDLGGLDLYGFVFSAFFVGSMLGIVIVGGFIDRVGVLRPFAVGLSLFAIGLTIAGLTPSMEVLVGARFIQGIGGGAIPPVAYVAIGRSLPERLRPQMMAVLSTAWVLPGVFGPALAGIVAELLHWRLVFLGLLPLVLVSGAIAWRALRDLPASTAPADVAFGRRIGDAVLVAIGVAALTAGLAGQTPEVVVGGGVGGVLLTAVAFRRLTPPGTLRAAPGYPTAILLRGILTFAFFCIDAYVALLLVGVRGWPAAAAGIALTAATLSWTGGSWVQAKLAGRVTPEQFLRLGFPVVAIGIAALGLVLVPTVPSWLAVPIFALAAFGMGLAYSQPTLIVLRDVAAGAQGRITSGLTLSDALGTALGTAVAGAIVAATVRAGVGPGPGIGLAIAIGASVALVGFVISARLREAPEPRRGVR
jgi:MFS family permease